MGAAVLAAHDNLFDFFHDEVDAATNATDSDVSEEGVFYLTNLLVEQGRTGSSTRPCTLAELHIRAARAPRATQIQNYRTLGDRALYVTGFFPESLSRKTVRASYYEDMGRAAYDRLAAILGRAPSEGDSGHKGLGEIFAELSMSFHTCIEVLREVHDAMRARTEQSPSEPELLALYEQWLSTGNQRALRTLQRHGLVPSSTGGNA
ncbi:MAG: hypothetical protein CL927_16110 [Deltaproteobacteria bacterium]|nr:hypothetical protein [Deltaproteobacteria bacterium]HCH61223.1 hypothetical protein [Deltaproteobacteria bacterium]